jgi:hypothetical protein
VTAQETCAGLILQAEEAALDTSSVGRPIGIGAPKIPAARWARLLARAWRVDVAAALTVWTHWTGGQYLFAGSPLRPVSVVVPKAQFVDGSCRSCWVAPMIHGLEVAQSDLSFGVRGGQAPSEQLPTRTRARSLLHHLNFPPLAPPSLPCPPFPPISISHVSQPPSSTSFASPQTRIVAFCPGSESTRRSCVPFVNLEIRRCFGFPAPAPAIHACALPAATFHPPTKFVQGIRVAPVSA